MKKLVLLICILVASLYAKPNVVILATGGTIAGSASGATNAQSTRPNLASISSSKPCLR